MTDRPIIFSAPMVRALLSGRKTQTRRLATSPLRRCEVGDRLWVRESCRAVELESGLDCIEYAATQDHEDEWGDAIGSSAEASDRWGQMLMYGRSGSIGRPRRVRRERGGVAGPWVPSIHMPRWASRLTLIVEAVRVEPLQVISEADAIAEGAAQLAHDGEGHFFEHAEGTFRCGYAGLWVHLHGACSWDANPVVVVLTFRVIRGNIDQVPA